MKKAILLIFVSILFLLPKIQSQSLRGNGNVIEQEREVSDFTNISVKDGVDVYISQGETVKVIVKTDENIQNSVITELNSDGLEIYVDGNIREVNTLNVYITIKDLESLEANDGSDVETLTVLNIDNIVIEGNDGSDLDLKINASQLECKLNDGSDAEIEGKITKANLSAEDGSDIDAEIIGDELTCEMYQGSDVSLKGEVNYANIKASQGSDLEAYNFTVKNFSLKLYGGSDAYINVTTNLDVHARGGSDVTVKGNPENRNVDVDEDSDLSFR